MKLILFIFGLAIFSPGRPGLAALATASATASASAPQGPAALPAGAASSAYVAPPPHGDFKFNLTVHPVTLNPLTAADNYAGEVMRWMVESLMSRDHETYGWVPRLAQSYTVSADGQTFTFELRPNVHFHDGSEFSSADVLYSFNVHVKHLYGVKSEWVTLSGFDRAEVLGKYRIRFHAQQKIFSSLETLASFPIVPQKFYDRPDGPTALNQVVMGSGPYRLKEYQIAGRLVLENSPEWWGRKDPRFHDRFRFAKIIVRFIEDEALALEMLEKGDLDYTPMSLDAYLKKTSGPRWGQKVFAERVSPLSVATWQASYFINLRRPIFAGLRTRQALQRLLNRPLMNEKFGGGQMLLATGPWHVHSDYADPSLKPVEYDPVEAARGLKADGWTDSDGDGVLDKVIAGVKTPFRFTMMYPKRDLERMLSVYQGDLKKAGVQMDLVQVDWAIFMKKCDELSFDAYVVGRGWPGVIDFNPRAEWHSNFTNLGGDNSIGYQNAQVDQLLDEAQREFDRPRRVKLLARAYRLIAEDQSQIFTFSNSAEYFGRSQRVHRPRPFFKYQLGFDTWWIED